MPLVAIRRSDWTNPSYEDATWLHGTDFTHLAQRDAQRIIDSAWARKKPVLIDGQIVQAPVLLEGTENYVVVWEVDVFEQPFSTDTPLWASVAHKIAISCTSCDASRWARSPRQLFYKYEGLKVDGVNVPEAEFFTIPLLVVPPLGHRVMQQKKISAHEECDICQNEHRAVVTAKLSEIEGPRKIYSAMVFGPHGGGLTVQLSDIEILQKSINTDSWLFVDDRLVNHNELAMKLLADENYELGWGPDSEPRLMPGLVGGVRPGRCSVP